MLSIIDPAAAALFLPGEALTRIASGCAWTEGPVWFEEDGSLLWSDIPNDRMMRWREGEDASVWRAPAEFANGHCRERDGSLLHCSHGRRAVMRTRFDAALRPVADEVVVDRYRGARLNSPNDVVVRSDGTIWFTDPPYGIRSDREGHVAASEQAANHVFRFDPASGALTIATDAVEEPNGLAFSPDEQTLYVTDSAAVTRHGGGHHVHAFPVATDGSLGPGTVVAAIAPGVPDGLRVDRRGWIYASSDDGVHVLDRAGTPLAHIAVPERVGNLTFGGADRDTLFICASTSIYRLRLNARGLG